MHNKLWEGHRIILPELREKATRCCGDCRFFVQIQDWEETRRGCVVGIPVYGTLQKRVPEVIPVSDLLKKAGGEELPKIFVRQDPQAPACGLYRPKLPK
ncbi:MAG: hypothetical protein AB1523_07365 [Bacillota bacterium]